jgi:hypothetical protein
MQQGAKMEEKVVIKNFEPLNERRNGLRPAVALFHYLAERCDVFNRIERPKRVIASDMNVSPRTVANWLHVLSDIDALKYKYSGSTRLNPKIYYVGTEQEYTCAINEYELFKSDI